MNLNQGQLQAMQDLHNFLRSNEKYHVLKGYAGTGKTTTMLSFLNSIDGFNQLNKSLGVDLPEYQLVFTATTNKAADVLRTLLKQDTSTIHSLLKLRPKMDSKNKGKMFLMPTGKVDLSPEMVIVVDEASCIDEELLGFIEKRTGNCKVLFCGDPNQLTPVGSDVSIVFEKGYNESMLTEIMRQAVSPLQHLCEALRNNVEKDELPDVEPNDIDILWLDRDDFDAAVLADMSRPDWKSSDSKYVAFTNKAVQEMNLKVKKVIVGEPRFQAGDLAVCNSYISNEDIRLSTDSIVVISNISHDQTNENVSGYVTEIEGVQFFTPYDFTEINKAQERAIKNGDMETFNVIKKYWIDLRPAYACTVHKSQGSTFKDVYVDLADLNKAQRMNMDLFNRLLYVAVSRGSQRVIFTG